MSTSKVLALTLSAILFTTTLHSGAGSEVKTDKRGIVFSGAEWASVSNNGKYVAVRKEKSVIVVDGDTGKVLHEVAVKATGLSTCVSDAGRVLCAVQRIAPPKLPKTPVSKEEMEKILGFQSESNPKFKPRFFNLKDNRWMDDSSVRIHNPDACFFAPSTEDIVFVADKNPWQRDFDVWKIDLANGTAKRFGLDPIAQGNELLLAALDENQILATNVLTDEYFKVKLKEDGSIETMKFPGICLSGHSSPSDAWQANNGELMATFLAEKPEEKYGKLKRAALIRLTTGEVVWRDQRMSGLSYRPSLAMARNSSRLAVCTDALKDGQIPPPKNGSDELYLVDYKTDDVTTLYELPIDQGFDLMAFSNSDKKLITFRLLDREVIFYSLPE